VDQAVSERRPLRRRPVTMARPARVRIRSRKPWTLARRRLFGWKVRLPLATTVSSSLLAATVAGPVLPSLICVEPARYRTLPVAAVPPTFGRLFEGTDVACAGQTALLSTPAASHRSYWHSA